MKDSIIEMVDRKSMTEEERLKDTAMRVIIAKKMGYNDLAYHLAGTKEPTKTEAEILEDERITNMMDEEEMKMLFTNCPFH